MKKALLFISLLIAISASSYSQCNTTNLLQINPQASPYGSVNTAGFEPARAYDMGSDSLSTKWSAPYNSSGHQWGVDFGVKFDFCSIRMVWGANEYPTGIVIKGTNDFSSWTTLASITGNTSNIITINFNPTDTFRIIDIYIYGTAPSAGNWGLYNMQIYKRSTNQKPVVTTSVNASYILGTDINITANASDADGTISKVAFYQGNTKLGEDLSSPYSYNWTGAALGTYSITARAFDNAGDSTTSAAVSVAVTSAPAYLKNWNLNGNNISNTNSGYVSIGGTITHLPTDTVALKLAVKGTIFAKKLTVTEALWSDYVFAPDYRLRPLKEVEHFILQHKHLPEVPSASEVAVNGINVGENQAILLKKIEELTLYVIKLNKEVSVLKRQAYKNSAGNKNK